MTSASSTTTLAFQDRAIASVDWPAKRPSAAIEA
jgi:hypothetical protein